MDTTLLKGLRLIEALARSTGPRGISELATELKLGKSNVHRTLNTLASAGYVSRDEPGGRYSLSLKLWELGARVVSRLEVKAEAYSQLHSLAAATQETGLLSILSGGDVIYIDRIESSQPLRTNIVIGGRAPAHAVATGRVLLAHQTEMALEAIARSVKTFNPSKLKPVFAEVRKRGYAVSSGEWNPGVGSIAAPIFGVQGVVAAIGISAPANRLTPTQVKRLAKLVVEAARSVSVRLGHSPAWR